MKTSLSIHCSCHFSIGKSERRLAFLNDLNTKHTLIKFGFKYSKEKIIFVNTLSCKDKNGHLQITLCKKPTNYLH